MKAEFPSEELRTSLSNIIVQIYLEVGGKADGKFYEEAWEQFGERVGWTMTNEK